MLPVTTIFAVVLFAAFQGLAVHVIRTRRGRRVAVGDGGDEALMRAIRAQGNLFEYGTVAVGLCALAEANGAPAAWLAALAIAFALGRASHAYGLLVTEPAGSDPGRFGWRVRGMMATLTVLPIFAITAIAALVIALVG